MIRLDQPAKKTLGGKPRGVAMLITLVTIAILSASVVEFVYANRVNLALASNEREKLKSYYLARSAFNISKLLLAFQFALQSESKETDDDLGQLIGRAMRRSNFQMYQYVDLLLGPFNSGKVESPVGGINLQDTGVSGFGDFTGEMDVDVIPEEGKININDYSTATLKEGDVQRLCALVLDQQYNDIFEQKDEDGETLDRPLVLQRILDYVDYNEEAVQLTNECKVQNSSGDELRPYDDRKIRPRNRKLTHIDELFQVAGVTEPFMDAFKDQFTVYPIGKPNLNVTRAPIIYSILCQNVQIKGAKAGVSAIDACRLDPAIATEVLWFAMALEGIKTFFENPFSVLMAYVGTTNSKLLPSAKKGQPVAFLSVSQFPSYLKDLKNSPALMSQFIQYSPMYQQMVAVNPELAVDPLAPAFPAWNVSYKKSGLMKSVTVTTPKVYRLKAIGRYGSTETTIEAVVDFDRSIRRVPSEAALEQDEADEDRLKELKEARKAQIDTMPKGRIMFWQEN